MTSSSNWLITAFDSFDQRPHNTSELILRELEKLTQTDSSLKALHFYFKVLPTQYDVSFEVLLETLKTLPPLTGVLSLGEGRDHLRIETYAYNLDQSQTQDNQGKIRKQSPILSNQEDKIQLHFPYESFSHLETSTDPGRFVCNHLSFKAAHYFKNSKTYFGFIHVPRIKNPSEHQEQIFYCAQQIIRGFKNYQPIL